MTERDGCLYMKRGESKEVSLDIVVANLEECADKHNDCTDCPDITSCREAYDNRCDADDVTCPSCGIIAPKYTNRFCRHCGALLTRGKKALSENK